jgi:alpha,alpha-trehalase
MVATTQAVMDRLGAGDGLIYRYLPDESPDGLPGHEGAFLLCSFWYVDNLAKQGRIDEALELYNSLCSRANPAGLLPEQIDPPSGRFLGNFPQAFSHVGVISSGVNIQLALEQQGRS